MSEHDCMLFISFLVIFYYFASITFKVLLSKAATLLEATLPPDRLILQVLIIKSES